jgi:hypothetical protein
LLLENREGKRRDNRGSEVSRQAWYLCLRFDPGERRGCMRRREACEADVRSEEFEVLERRLGGDVGHEENGVLAKKSAVRERDDEGLREEWTVRFGSGVGMSAMGLEKKAAVLDTVGHGLGCRGTCWRFEG